MLTNADYTYVAYEEMITDARYAPFYYTLGVH